MATMANIVRMLLEHSTVVVQGLPVLNAELQRGAARSPPLVAEFLETEPDFKSVFATFAILTEMKSRHEVRWCGAV